MHGRYTYHLASNSCSLNGGTSGTRQVGLICLAGGPWHSYSVNVIQDLLSSASTLAN